MLNFDDSSGKFFAQSNSDNNAEFVNRQRDVFGKLDAVVNDKEKDLERLNRSKRNRPVDDVKPHKKQRLDTRQFRGQESIFKRPEAPPPSRFIKNIPDYQRHPQKWTKYTLSDVSPEDMSDRSNTAAALSFLKELKAKKDLDNMDEEGAEAQITFKKPSRSTTQVTESGSAAKFDSPIFRSSKVIMPEYVVGEKKLTKTITRKLGKIEKRQEIKLNHLDEEDDE